MPPTTNPVQQPQLPPQPGAGVTPETGGDLYQYNQRPQPSGYSPTDLNTSMMNMAMGSQTMPYLQPLLEAMNQRQRQDTDRRTGSLATRGILNSTIGQNELDTQAVGQRGELANTYLDTFNRMAQPMTAISQNAYGQRLGREQQDLGNYFNFYDRQTADDRYRRQEQMAMLAQLMNAVGQATPAQQMPSFNTPPEQPGAGAAIGNILGNAANSWIMSNRALPWS